MKVSCHTHTESHLTGSTISSMVDLASELGRTHFAHTDNGHLASSLKTYSLVKKKKLKPILGIEIYFKDSKCPILAGTSADRCRYFTLSIYAIDQVAYQELCRIVSKPMPTIDLYDEPQQLWSWEDLERISKFNVEVVLGGLHCIVGKTMLAGKADLADKVLVKLNELFKNHLSLAIIAEPWTKKWNSIVEFQYLGGRDTCLATDMVTTDRARRIKASDVVERGGHTTIKAIYSNNSFKEVNQILSNATEHKGFLPLPGGDAQLKNNRFLKIMAAKHGLPLLVSDYAYYSNKEDKVVQTVKLEGVNRLHSNLYMKSEKEIISYLQNSLSLSPTDTQNIIANNDKWASKFDNFDLKYDWRLADPGEDPLKKIMSIIKQNGRMKWDDQKYVDRLREELNVIAKNGKMDLSAYFLPIHDVVDYYKKNGRLSGPGRGSAAGSLVSFLLGITEVNPFKYDLSFSRFYSLDRIFANKIADIDHDLESRDLLIGEDGKSGYLYGRWGNKAAQISTRQNLRIKSAIKDVNRFMNGEVEEYIERLTKGLPVTPQGIKDLDFVFGYENDEGDHIKGLFETSEPLQEYAEKKPSEWEVVKKSLGVVRGNSVHACAFVIADCPISDVVPVKDGHITQVEATQAEAAGLVKMDFLVISQLKDIRVCLDLINDRNGDKLDVGYFNHNGVRTYIWDLPEDPHVFRSVWNGGTETCFQINTGTMLPYVQGILPRNIEDLSLILSLVRPGPLDYIDPNTGRNMAEEYIHRRDGGSYEDIEILNEIIPETMSVLVYQEQITKIAKVLAGFTGLEAENLREAIGKKKQSVLSEMKPKFVSGVVASGKATQTEAETLWDRIDTFGRYAFNKSHGISYSFITYACMFLKHHYKLAWWAATLTNASEQEITGKFWPYVKDLVASPDINLSSDVMVVDHANEKIRAKMGIIRGMGDATIDPIVANRPYQDIQDFVNKDVAGPSLTYKLTHVGVLDSLYPAKSTLVEKLQLLENAREIKKFNDKVEKAKLEGKSVRATEPKIGIVSEEYLKLTPMEDAAKKKATLPTMPLNLYSLGSEHSKVKSPNTVSSVSNSRGIPTRLANSEVLERIVGLDGNDLEKDIYVASTCFVLDMSEFAYPKANPTKRALKLRLDSDGFSGEYVLWPDYDTGQLIYPEDLKKGKIITAFMRKKKGRNDLSISEIIVEA